MVGKVVGGKADKEKADKETNKAEEKAVEGKKGEDTKDAKADSKEEKKEEESKKEDKASAEEEKPPAETKKIQVTVDLNSDPNWNSDEGHMTKVFQGNREKDENESEYPDGELDSDIAATQESLHKSEKTLGRKLRLPS
jgi:hypothetical protein